MDFLMLSVEKCHLNNKIMIMGLLLMFIICVKGHHKVNLNIWCYYPIGMGMTQQTPLEVWWWKASWGSCVCCSIKKHNIKHWLVHNMEYESIPYLLCAAQCLVYAISFEYLKIKKSTYTALYIFIIQRWMRECGDDFRCTKVNLIAQTTWTLTWTLSVLSQRSPQSCMTVFRGHYMTCVWVYMVTGAIALRVAIQNIIENYNDAAQFSLCYSCSPIVQWQSNAAIMFESQGLRKG